MNDEDPLTQYNIEESKCVVLFVVKVTKPSIVEPSKPTTLAATNTSSSATSAAAASSAAAALTVSTTKPAESSTLSSESKTTASDAATSALSNATPSSAQSQAESQMLIGTELESVIRNIMEMGYDRPQVERALQASFNNPERAVEYLVSGNIPADEGMAELAPEVEARAQSAGQGGQANPLEFLRNQPQYNQMCQLLRSNPNLLQTIMSQLRSSNPELLNLISQNQDDFLRMVNESTPSTGNTGGTPAVSSRPSSAHSDSTAGSAQFEGLVDESTFSATDKAAIRRVNLSEFVYHSPLKVWSF